MATPTVTVVVSAFGALTGSTSSRTPPTTASARARPTNTTNAYIGSLLLRDASARRFTGFDSRDEPWLQVESKNFELTSNQRCRGRSNPLDVDPALVRAC